MHCSAGRNIKQTTLSETLDIHRDTLRKRLKENDIKVSYSSISNRRLDKRIRSIREQRPNAGWRYVLGNLRTQGLRI